MESELSHPSERTLTAVRSVALAAVPLVFLLACAADDGVRVQVISMERPPEGLGMRPPADYTPCWSGEARAYDTDGDGKADRVRVRFQGKDRCYGEDANHDGKIDTWDVLDESGNLAKRAHDSNGDGRVDQSWSFDPGRQGCAKVTVDRDGDGQPDGIGALDLCPANSAAPAAAPPPAAPPGPTPTPSTPTSAPKP
jgi:hypothetical protein